MAGDGETPLLGSSGNRRGYKMRPVFPIISGIAIIILLVFFFLFVDYATFSDDSENYMYYVHVALMVWVGFGFLMTFLKKYSMGAVALNYFTSCIIVLEAVLIIGAFEYWAEKRKDVENPPASDAASDVKVINLNIKLLIEAMFCAAAGMITFGAVLGKASPSQLLLLMIIEVPFYAFNAVYLLGDNRLLSTKQEIRDVGASMAIHTFGAYFGLTASLFLSRKGTDSGHRNNGSAYLNDITSMIGTIFLWIFWPSFNAAMALPEDRFTVLLNTIVSLCAACATTFLMSSSLHGKFDVVHIQNATLAGGVAVGSAADMDVGPGGALAIGIVAAIVSTVGFSFLSPFMEKCCGLKDTCGVHNLHGMPGILGGLAAAVTFLVVKDDGWVANFGAEILALVLTVVVAIVGGGISGFLFMWVDRVSNKEAVEFAFDDSAAFHIGEV